MSRKYLYEVHAILNTRDAWDMVTRHELCLAGRDKPEWTVISAMHWIGDNAFELREDYSDVHIHCRSRETGRLSAYTTNDYDHDALVAAEDMSMARAAIRIGCIYE